MLDLVTTGIKSLARYGKKLGGYNMRLKKPFIIILIVYTLVAVLPFIAAFFFLMIQAIVEHKPDIDRFIKLGSVFISDSFIAFIAFAVGLTIDSNDNGIADMFEGNGKYSYSHTIDDNENPENNVLDKMLQEKKDKDSKNLEEKK